MIDLKIENRKGKIHVKSSEIKDILELRPDFEYVQDISNTINQENILVFDCQLTGNSFDMDDLDIEEISKDNGLVMVLNVEVKPEFELGNYKGIEIAKV